jgi:hypothetical protein
MENINNYLKGGSADKSFSDVPYNEVDALVFSTLAYIPMDGKVPGLNSRNDTITIEEFVDEIKKSEKYADFLKSKKPEEAARFNDFVQSLKNSDRYKDVTLNNFSNIYKPENEEQFAAVTINLPDGSRVVSFRGTDGTMAGWNEDFNLAFSDEVPAQADAREYLNAVAEKTENGSIYVTGHSKGGHLAIYSSLTCEASVKDRIINIYNFDGPGLRHDILYKYSNQYQEIKDKITAYVPQTSMIGMLLNDHENIECVNSNESGIMQHDLFSWEFDEKGKLVINPKGLDELSRFINNTLDDTLDSMSIREREVLIDTVFMLGSQGGEQDFDNIFAAYKGYFKDGDVISGITKILKDINDLNVEQKEVLLRTVSVFMLAAVDNGAIDYARVGIDRWAIETKQKINESFDKFISWGVWAGLNPITIRLAEKLCEELINTVNAVIKSFLNFVERGIRGDFNSYTNYGALQVNLAHIEVLAHRLSYIHNKVMRLDNELNNLRDSLEWYEIIDSLRVSGVDFLFVGYDYDLKKCIDYMNFTISKLTACENRLYQNAKAF